MLWSEIRKTHPNQWLIVEALEAHTLSDKKRLLNRLAVIESCSDGIIAMQRYRQLHQRFPEREFYFIHTSRDEPDVQEHEWLGVRVNHAIENQI